MNEEHQSEKLSRENAVLSQQVKRLIKAEGKLYEYQQELDDQLKEYKALYDLSRRLSGSFDLQDLFQQTVEYVIQQLEFERAVFFRRTPTGSYSVCALDGYYDQAERDAVSLLSIEPGTPCLAPLLAGREHITYTAQMQDPCISPYRLQLRMNEFFVYPLGYDPLPYALLVVGNSAENASFYRKVEDAPGALVSMGNLTGLVSSLIESHIFFERMTQAREQERLAEARYRSLFENAAEGIFQRTPDGRYLNANPSLAHMLGYASPEELMAEVTDIGGQLYVDQLYHEDLMRQLDACGRVDGFETQLCRRDGTTMWVSISIRQVCDHEGSVLLYEGMVEEISKRKEAENALRESERKYRQLSEALEQRVKETVDELRQKDRMLIMQGRQAVLGEMLSNIAHQWRQPLNLLALLAQDLLLTQKKHMLTGELIESNIGKTMEIIRQMSKTIDDFRYFFRPDQGRQLFRVKEPLEKALSLLEGSFSMHGIRIEMAATGDPTIDGYLSEFIQVLLNILINARDALIERAPRNPRISIRLFSEGARTVVSIADNAGGIPEAIIDKIFDPYFTTKGPEQGTGIGLFMCKTIIEKNMNGALTARNTEDGAEFRIDVRNGR